MKKIFLLLMLSAATFSCSDDEPQSYAESPYIVGFNTAARAESYVASGDVATLNVPVVLLGGMTGLPAGSDVTVSYSVDPSSTATEGNEFSFVNSGGSVVMPAGEDFVNIPISINTGNLDAGPDVVAKYIILNITSAVSSDSVVVAEQYKQIKITLNGLCFSDLGGDYNLSVTRLDNGTVYSLPGEVLTPQAGQDGVYRTNSTGPYNDRGLVSATAQIPGIGFTFTDICGVANIQLGETLTGYSNSVYQTADDLANSNYDETTGVLTILYHIHFNPTIERPYKGVYTPL